jgi:hypothetical protein
MRRAIAMAVSSGLVLGGAVLGGAIAAAGVATAATARARTAVHDRTAARTRIVVYAGYQLTVPASWPVYRLDQDPATCVQYAVHAVYLGVPGADQQCPASLIGRTETVAIAAASGTPAGGVGRTDGLARAGRLASAKSVALDAEDHEVRVTLARDGQVRATVVGTYGDDPALIRQVLATVRPAPVQAKSSPATPAVGRSGQAEHASQPVLKAVAAPMPTMTAQVPARRSPRPAEVSRPARARVQTGQPTRGFDACTAPPTAAMKAWRRDYSVVGIYIGGVNASCGSGNLSASWIVAAANMGWSMLPVYVGPQAPCLGYGAKISRRKAAQQGAAAARDAALDARRYGLRARSPIYYDMEAFAGSSACTTAVLQFLSAWTRELNAKGYVSGVYSSLDSGIFDMQSALARNQGFTPPQAVWYALWDGQGRLSAGNLVWPQDKRAKQFQGPHNSTIGGYTLNIDSDIVDGPVAR